MNRFRGRKKAKDDLAAAQRPSPRPSVESESSGPFKMFGTKKTPEEEPKKELDLTSALPSSDEFRTSLLMTGLSARFSMLREQDDPNTKVGKASDDSVLYPKRQSRMMDFGYHGGLTDIAEVESIKGPGFARVHSFVSTDDAASTSGSIMSRAKPTEGNNLFGGRQKIYKIPAGGLSKNGSLPGRALYEDDVAQSAFQKWRQAERERRSLDDDTKDDSLESDETRPDSPSQPDFSRRRETSSTTSSGPRNSTAATSITSSQPSSSVKDWQSATMGATSPIPGMERSVTRTRRLYEQSLNQDLQDQQSSALSRIDTLSKQRNFGTRTPDLTPVMPSPTSATFSDRFANNRSILSKASAPNLRSFTPSSNSSSQMSPIEPSNKFSSFEQRTSFGAAPPLSPPISETEEHAVLPIGPNDRGKATALGVFSKPTSTYDESRYAQRQIQLQQGRETPTDRVRTNSNASEPTSRSRSPSVHRNPVERHDSTSLKPQSTIVEETQTSTFFDDDDDDQSADEEPPRLSLPPQVTLKRPDDDDHPAFRKSALPTPLTLTFKATDGPSPIAEGFEFSNANSKNVSPEDSPTLGPTSGLSGMVRQHLRSDSGSSSVYDSQPNDNELASRFPPERQEQGSSDSMDVSANVWAPSVSDWAISLDERPSSPTSKYEAEPQGAELRQPSSTRESKSDLEEEKEENDEFARHLADGARRVRERLTSYVESGTNIITPPPVPAAEPPPPPRVNALGILKSKSSRGSLIDRSRGDKEGLSQSKAKKLLGLSSSTMAVSPSAKQTTFEINEEPRKSDRPSSGEQPDDEERSGPEKENIHAGLKAFRQARRELQRMKEMEVQQRYQGPPKTSPTHEHTPAVVSDPRAPSQERRPPISYNNRVPSEESRNNPRSRSGSRAPSERDRSGSETSSVGRSGSRPPPRLRNGSIPYDDHHGPMGLPHGPNGMPRQGPMLRSPGMPDMKRSPHMPPQPYQTGNVSPGRFKRSESAQNLTVQAYGGYEPGQPSPISPLNGAPSPYGLPNGPSPRPQGPPHSGSLDPNHPANRMMRTRDFSEPSFASPPPQQSLGSRSRSGSLLQAAASTPNLHANMTAPPVPPINPRRKNNMMGGLMRRSEDEMTMSSPHLPMSPARNDDGHLPSTSDDDNGSNGRFHQKLRKATSEAHSMNVRARSMRNSPPQPLNRPPLPPPMAGQPGHALPGGMI